MQKKLDFLEPKECVDVCEKTYKKSADKDVKKMRLLKKAMHQNYQHHWIIDNLPVIWCYTTENQKKFCSRGFPVGCFVNKFGVQKEICRLFVSVFYLIYFD